MSQLKAETALTGGLVNYYLVRVEDPQREEQEPYTAECEDLIDALALTPNEANIFKEIWRSANARQGNGKPDHKAKYGAEKIVHYAKRILRKHEIQARKVQETTNAEKDWYPNDPATLPVGSDKVVVKLRNGEYKKGVARDFDWLKSNSLGDIMQWVYINDNPK